MMNWIRWSIVTLAIAVVAVAEQPGPGRRAWTDRIAAVSAAEFWKHLEADGLVSNNSYPSFWRELDDQAGAGAAGRAGAIRALDAALAIGDIRNGPHVEVLDYEGSHVIGHPQIHSVYAFRNQQFDVWFLRSKILSRDWDQWALVQDKRIEPNVAYYFQYRNGRPSRVDETNDCYRCHSNGPRAIHPGRSDLVNGREYIDEINKHCAEQIQVQIDFGDPRPDFGPELAIADCTDCHSTGADRGPLFRIQSHSIRAMITRGIMPPDGELSREGGLRLERWLSGSDSQ